ncbi:MAG: hypothetical protein ACO3AD_18750 [Burkholderiaceae bacterium]
MTLAEDTPQGGPEELQWKIDRLIEQVQRHSGALDHERAMRSDVQRKLTEKCEQWDHLTSRLSVKVLREAGLRVDIAVPDGWTEGYDDDDCC